MNNRTTISLEDIEEINQRMLVEKPVQKKPTDGKLNWFTIVLIILGLILLIGVVIYFLEEKEKKKKEVQIKSEDGSIKTIKKTVSTSETEEAIQKLIAT